MMLTSVRNALDLGLRDDFWAVYYRSNAWPWRFPTVHLVTGIGSVVCNFEQLHHSAHDRNRYDSLACPNLVMVKIERQPYYTQVTSNNRNV